MASFTADELLRAFIAASAKDGKHVTFAERSAPGGYVRVYGPSADPSDTSASYVIIEDQTGAVAVTEELTPFLPVRDRPGRPIAHDPSGFSSGPNYGRYRWTVVTDDISTPAALVSRVADAFRKAKIEW